MTEVCSWCEGKGITGRLDYGEQPRALAILGRTVPIVGTLADRPCGYCLGRGRVPDGFDYVKRPGDYCQYDPERPGHRFRWKPDQERG